MALPEKSIAQLSELIVRYDGPQPQLHACDGIGHRFRSRLSARGRRGAIQLGIFEAGSHRLVNIARCPVHHESINVLCAQLTAHLNELLIEPYDEVSHTGMLRAVQLAVEPSSGKVQLGLLVFSDQLQNLAAQPQWSELLARLGTATHSVFLGALPKADNSLLAQQWLRTSGPDMMRDCSGGAQVFYPPDAFGQANPVLHAQVVELIHQLVGEATSVFEYYAGVGTIGLGLCGDGRRVTFNEVGAGSLRGLRKGLAHRDITYDTRADRLQDARVLEGSAGQHADAYSPDDSVIVDPPRKGLDAPLLARLRREPPRRLVYLSCGLPAFLREAEILLQSGQYEIEHASAWAYFPFTEHIESLVSFTRI